MASVREVKGMGYFLFRAKASTSPFGVVELEPPPGEFMILRDGATEDWILRRLAETGQVTPRDREGGTPPSS